MSKNPAGNQDDMDSSQEESGKRPPHDAGDEKAAQLGIRAQAAAGTAAFARPINLRRSSHALQLFGLLFVVVLLLFAALLAGLYTFYENSIQPRLNRAAAASSAAASQAPTVPAAVRIDIPEEVKAELAAASAKVGELQKQIDTMRETAAQMDSRQREVSDRVTSLASAAARGQNTAPPVSPTDATEVKPEVAAVVQVTSPTNQELVLLKERNRLTAWADEAIATGKRKSLDMLISRLTDPEHARMRDAAFAEIQRVYYHLRFSIRIDPGYRIPVNELFKDGKVRDESELKTEQLIGLLHDQEKAWEVRLRSAWLLGGRRTPEVSKALIKSLKEDPVLDVAKEAQLSLEQNVGRKFLLLDIPAIDEWWKEQNGEKPEKKSDKAKPEDKTAAANDNGKAKKSENETEKAAENKSDPLELPQASPPPAPAENGAGSAAGKDEKMDAKGDKLADGVGANPPSTTNQAPSSSSDGETAKSTKTAETAPASSSKPARSSGANAATSKKSSGGTTKKKSSR